MGYSPKVCPAGESTGRRENHEILRLEVYTREGFVGIVERTVMCDNGIRYITYDHQRYHVKRLRQDAANRRTGTHKLLVKDRNA